MTEHSSAHALLQQLQSWKTFLTLLGAALTSSRRGKMTNTSRKYIHRGNKLHFQCWGALIWIWWCLILFGVWNSGPTARGSFRCQMETKQSWDGLILVTQGCYMWLYIHVCMFLLAHVLFYHKRLVTLSAHLGKDPVQVTQTSHLVSQLPCKHSRAQWGLGAACSPGHCSAVVFWESKTTGKLLILLQFIFKHSWDQRLLNTNAKCKTYKSKTKGSLTQTLLQAFTQGNIQWAV